MRGRGVRARGVRGRRVRGRGVRVAVVVEVVSLVVVVGTNDIHMRNGPLLLLRNREKKLGERMQP